MKRKKDYYYKKAKKEGYKSRAVYKLIEIDKKYKIFQENIYVLDIGTSPGSWSQYILNKYKNVKIVGIDLIPPSINDNRYIFIKGDINDKNIRETLSSYKFDVILSDACPKLTGIRDIDDMRMYELLINVLELLTICLKKDGSAIVKALQFKEFYNVYKKYKKIFRFCKIYKPKASVKRSREIYIICKRKRI